MIDMLSAAAKMKRAEQERQLLPALTTSFLRTKESIMAESQPTRDHAPSQLNESLPSVEYRQIPYAPRYRVGDDGSVWRHTKKRGWLRLKPKVYRHKDKEYVRITLTIGEQRVSKAVHRLVLELFVGACPEGMEGCHDPDPSRTNNALSNLKWGTKQENADDRVRHGHQVRGTAVNSAKLDEGKVKEILLLLRSGMSQKAVGLRFGIGQKTVSCIARRKIWRHVDA